MNLIENTFKKGISMGFDLSKIQAIKNEQNTDLLTRISEFRSKVDSEKFEDIIQKRAEKTIAGGRSFFSVKVNYYRDNDADKYFVCVDYGFFNVEAYSLAGKQKDEQLALMDKFAGVVREKITSLGLGISEEPFRYALETYDRILDKNNCSIMGQYHFKVKL